MLIFVGAHGRNYEIGNKGHLPWRHARMQNDVARLHVLVDGKHVVVGERTYRIYKDIKAKFKTNQVTVLSSTIKNISNAEVAHSIEEIVERSKSEDLWVIGGGNVFTQLLPYADKMYLTRIEAEFKADVFFPEYSLKEWEIISEKSYPADEDNPYPYSFLELQKPR